MKHTTTFFYQYNKFRMLRLCCITALFVLLGYATLHYAVAGPLPTLTDTQSALLCDLGKAVPTQECDALTALYATANGTGWREQKNWLVQSASFPCDWYGVRCTNGHISELRLEANQLSGTLPISVGYLSELTVLRLENNALGGTIPRKVCNITQKLSDFSIAYNRFDTSYRAARTCIETLEPTWLETQTLAPRNVTISEFYTDALRLTWSPIPYTGDGGYYEVSYATEYDGPYTVHGKTADKTADTYLVNNLLPGQRYFFHVRTYTPPHDQQPNGLYSTNALAVGMTVATTGNVLVAAYFPADNDLSSQISYVLMRMRRGTQFNPNVTVVLLVDGLGKENTRLLVIRNGEVTQTNVVEKVWGVRELDTADPATLTWFLSYARKNYPATKEIVSLMGHGLALAPELSFVDSVQQASMEQVDVVQSDKFPPLPRDWEDMPNDVTDNSYMSTTDVGEALLAATNQGTDPFDVVFFDQCFQGALDALYEVYATAEMFVASPNYAWLVAAYDKYILGFSPNMDAQELASNIINPYQNTLDRRHPNAIFAVPGAAISEIANAVSALGDALTNAVNDGQQALVANAVRNSSYVDTTQCGNRTLQLGPPDELIGIESFGQGLLGQFPVGDAYGVNMAVEKIRVAMQGVERMNKSGRPYIAPDEFWDYGDSLTILAPLPRNTLPGVAWRASIYRPDAPFSATWSLDGTDSVIVTKSLAFAKAGRWDDFLATWFQNLTPTVGQWCHYIPPEQVVLDGAETLSLTATLDDLPGLTVEWTATDDLSATEYLLYLDGPYEVSWKVDRTMSITETAATLPALDSGLYQFQLLARNDENEFVAQSNIVTVEVPDVLSPTAATIYLPVVLR